MAKNRKKFYNTGIRIIFSFFDIFKFKLRLSDYDDTKGVHYNYLFSFKIFGFERYREKYTDQKGQVYKRKIKFRG